MNKEKIYITGVPGQEVSFWAKYLEGPRVDIIRTALRLYKETYEADFKMLSSERKEISKEEFYSNIYENYQKNKPKLMVEGEDVSLDVLHQIKKLLFKEVKLLENL
tara:strand:+ start:38788 stop:39105 length:318 start_codon:yes stop_codon:yes gene_type:complete